jgi:regulator of replication initiation timing
MSEMQLVVMIDELKRQLQELHAENARLRHERDVARANALAMLPQGTPEELAEMEAAMATAVPFNVTEIVAEIEGKK